VGHHCCAIFFYITTFKFLAIMQGKTPMTLPSLIHNNFKLETCGITTIRRPSKWGKEVERILKWILPQKKLYNITLVQEMNKKLHPITWHLNWCTPNSLKDSNANSKMKTMKEKGVGVHYLICSISRVKKVC